MSKKVREPKTYEKAIKNWPEDDRPREKLLKKGARALSNSELLAILLRTGVNGASAIDLARKILKKFSTFRNMAHTDARDWKDLKGLGTAKVAHIQAALEIGRRFREDEASAGKQKVSSAKDIVDILMPQMRDLKTESFKVVYLDSNNRVIDIADAATGTVDHAMPIVREIIHSALQKFAASIICAHNHPSGNITPSAQDKKFTKELSDAGKLMEIKLMDHIIIGEDEHFSFADEGLMM
ncbi:MAG TPA: DNA repair protein RadC [Smithellaceae bacterium]|jgi:DNA repair protein RadC|nr:DNA repair protein RadC [Smithellaceae bacterium]HPM09678.1 DNA repair protein RadC [Paludibacter sp.]